ncbi:MAG: 3-isopropylmalate dehydratase [Burkholderiales bacterium]|nr:3-isopropylmalate dehydratase [Burkholderiales bacterium]
MTEFSWRLQGRCYRLGHNVPHAGGVIPDRLITSREFDPQKLVPHLFEETDPGFHERARAGDIIVAGRRFGMGPKMNGYIAMQALGLGLVCESMPYLAYRAAIGCGVRVLTDCTDVTEACATGDALEVDFAQGLFVNRTRALGLHFPPLPAALQEIVAVGGNVGWLADWWRRQTVARA